MRLWHIFIAAIFVMLNATSALAQAGSAAIAYCIDKRSVGVGESSRSDLDLVGNAGMAIADAIEKCFASGGQKGCCTIRISSDKKFSCIALATGSGTRFGTGRGTTQREAAQNAKSGCGGGFCKVAASKCAIINDSNVSGEARSVPREPSGIERFNGTWQGSRGYTDRGRPSPNRLCRSHYSFSVTIRDGQLTMHSDNRYWRGKVYPDGSISIKRSGISPPPKNSMSVLGPLENARMYSGYCGNGFFRLRR